jgi:cytosine/adenosine deaminase-related metal-dependent hydrolase
MSYSPRRFVDWIIQLIKITRNLQAEDFRTSLVEGLRICVEAGTTSVGDVLSRYDLASAYSVPPIGGRIFFEVLGQEAVRFNSRLEQALELCAGQSDSALHSGLSPHTAYTTSENNLHAIRDAVMARSLPLMVHVSESQAESDFIFDSSGPLAEEFYPYVGWEPFLVAPRRCSSTELLDRHGLLTPATLAVHCVHVNLADAHILKQRGTTVCLCPRSNERLDVGKAPVALFKKLAIPLALGTDSLASNDSLSLWDEIRFALDQFADELSPADLFRMATSGGAKALGLSSSVGSLEAGKRADFQVIAQAGADEKGLLERIIGQGRIVDVYLSGLPGHP